MSSSLAELMTLTESLPDRNADTEMDIEEINKLKIIIDNISEELFLSNESLHRVNKQGIILWASQMELDTLGYKKGEYFGKPVSEIHKDQVVIENILNKLKRGETIENVPARLIAKDGKIVRVLINSSVVYDVNKKFKYTRCYTREVPEWINIEFKIEENIAKLEQQSLI